MLFVVWMPLILQLLLPLGLLAWLALGRPASRLSWALRVMLAAIYLAVIAAAGLWLVLPWHTPVAYAVGLPLATMLSARRLREAPRWPVGWGQSYGVDIEKLDVFGFRARGILPRDPAAYAIFGDSLSAPCAGTVVTTLDGVPEMHPPEMGRRHMTGNHVILRCGAVWVVLGHLRQGSVAVRAGDSVDVGEPLGRVGNSGNTGEPHLHIHAQRPGTPDAPLSGNPLPVRFGAIYPSRNTRIRTR